jgi:hypothetical protein
MKTLLKVRIIVVDILRDVTHLEELTPTAGEKIQNAGIVARNLLCLE